MNKQLHAFEGMQATKHGYAASDMSDSDWARQLSTASGARYSTAQVRNYRQVLGIPNNVQTPISLKAQLDEAKRLLKWVRDSEEPFNSNLDAEIAKFLGEK